MSATASTARTRDDDRRHPAKMYCLLAGAALLLAGVVGMLVDSTFDTASGDTLQGDSLVGFEVNGWHNVVHILSGLFLLAMSRRRDTARTGALAFGIVYGLVAIIGLIDGNDVLGLIPVNPADNVLHALLSVLGMAAGLMSKGDDHDRGEHRSGDRGAGQDARDATRAGADGARVERSGSDSQVVAPTDGNGGAGREGVRARR